MSQVAIGTPAPLFELKTADGQFHGLSEALERGTVVLVFYKASCPPCQFTFPFIQQIYSKIGGSAGWPFWAISQDEPEENRAFPRQHGLTFDLLSAQDHYSAGL